VGGADLRSESLADVQTTREHSGAADPLWAILSVLAQPRVGSCYFIRKGRTDL